MPEDGDECDEGEAGEAEEERAREREPPYLYI